MNDERILLIGGNGFIGKGLQREMNSRGMKWTSIDRTQNIDRIDVSDDRNIDKLYKYINDNDVIIILASSIGSRLFKENPRNAFENSLSILRNVVHSLERIYMETRKTKKIVWFSTSEIYYSTNSIDDLISKTTTEPRILQNDTRSLYAQIKLIGETWLQSLLDDGVIESLMIVRPFNISGMGQRRGVVYEMVKQAVETGRITYCRDTTRTITGIDYISDRVIDQIVTGKYRIHTINVSQPEFSTTMKILAETIRDVIVSDGVKSFIELVEIDQDPQSFRHTGRVMKTPSIEFVKFMRKIVKDIVEDL